MVRERTARVRAADAKQMPLTVSEATLERLQQGEHAAKSGKCETKAKNVAKTGEKTIRYEAADKTAECTFNYSDDTGLMGATAVFQAIADTMQRGERLQHDLRYDRLGLDAEMESLVAAQKDGSAIEIGNIATGAAGAGVGRSCDRPRAAQGGAAASGLGPAGAGGIRSERPVELSHRFKRDSFSADLRGEIVRPCALQLRCG